MKKKIHISWELHTYAHRYLEDFSVYTYWCEILILIIIHNIFIFMSTYEVIILLLCLINLQKFKLLFICFFLRFTNKIFIYKKFLSKDIYYFRLNKYIITRCWLWRYKSKILIFINQVLIVLIFLVVVVVNN
jgi:hypothetical protein